jgi:hypothetical protein
MYKGKGNTKGTTERRRPVSREKLARDTAHSIRARIAEGRSWSLSEYRVDGDVEIMRMVRKHLVDN